MTKSALFDSTTNYRAAFIAGLEKMLAEHDGLGVFILTLANATFDERIQQRLQTPLRTRFEQLADQLKSDLAAGRSLREASDDVLVFLKLLAVGLDQLPLTRFRHTGKFALQFNLLRAFRPPRMSDVVVNQLTRPFQTEGFHFNKPFLTKEILWSGELAGMPARLFYNKFPFAPLHGLLVLQPEQQWQQYLSREMHLSVWQIAQQLGQGMPGMGFGYNAYGAYASVNHLHFQMYVGDEGGFPVEHPRWAHHGGDRAYPVSCRYLEDPDQAWQIIAALHVQNCPYNLLYRPGGVYVMSRRFQGSYTHAAWTGGFAWAELCGAVTTFNANDFEQLGDEDIEAELAKLVVAEDRP